MKIVHTTSNVHKTSNKHIQEGKKSQDMQCKSYLSLVIKDLYLLISTWKKNTRKNPVYFSTNLSKLKTHLIQVHGVKYQAHPFSRLFHMFDYGQLKFQCCQFHVFHFMQFNFFWLRFLIVGLYITNSKSESYGTFYLKYEISCEG